MPHYAHPAAAKNSDRIGRRGIFKSPEGQILGLLFNVCGQATQVIAQRAPLFKAELIAPDHADANAGGVIALHMRTDFIQVTAGRDHASRVDDKVIADTGEAGLLLLAPLRLPGKAALPMPEIYLLYRRDEILLTQLAGKESATVRRIRTVNDYEIYFAWHARTLRAREGRVKAEALPGFPLLARRGRVKLFALLALKPCNIYLKYRDYIHPQS